MSIPLSRAVEAESRNNPETGPGRGTDLVFGRVRCLRFSIRVMLIFCSGGIRGIVELVVLREIEHELGQNFRIQDFFDLIVGTR